MGSCDRRERERDETRACTLIILTEQIQNQKTSFQNQIFTQAQDDVSAQRSNDNTRLSTYGQDFRIVFW
jgi:hypothetical protein